MIKQTPSLGRIIAMVVFTLSCFGLLLFLWLAFGGPIPLKPQGYRLKVASAQEAATLAVEADVRMAGVNVGKVKTKELDKDAARTIVEMEIKPQYAPIPKNARVIQRQKTLLGETYVEVSVGDKSTGDLEDGSTLPNVHVEENGGSSTRYSTPLTRRRATRSRSGWPSYPKRSRTSAARA